MMQTAPFNCPPNGFQPMGFGKNAATQSQFPPPPMMPWQGPNPFMQQMGHHPKGSAIQDINSGVCRKCIKNDDCSECSESSSEEEEPVKIKKKKRKRSQNIP